MKYILPFLIFFTSSSTIFAGDTIDQANQKEKQSQLTRLVKVAVPVCTVLAAITARAYIKHQQVPDLYYIFVTVPGVKKIFPIDSNTDCATIITQVKQSGAFRSIRRGKLGLEVCYRKQFFSFKNTLQYVDEKCKIQEIIKQYRSNIFELFVAI